MDDDDTVIESDIDEAWIDYGEPVGATRLPAGAPL